MLPEAWTRTRRGFGAETSHWHRLKPGQTVCFGAMAQPELHMARLRVTGCKEYDFPQAGFSAFSLSADHQPLCWMIVAEMTGAAPYLALSRRLLPEDLARLLTDEDVLTLSHSSRMKHLYLREQTPGLREWVTMRYDRRIEGIRGKQRERGTERAFEYELYVSEGNDRAIEVERFPDGHMEVYATIYRPTRDVLEVIPPPRLVAVPKPEAEVKPEIRPAAPPVHITRAAAASLKDVEETRRIMRRQPMLQAVEPAAPPPHRGGGRLECTASTAWRLLDEARRGGIRLSDVVRKVLGLPVETSERISFEFLLTEADYLLLGKRYGIDPKHQPAIRAKMAQELEDFAGK